MVESADNKQKTELQPSFDLKSDLFSDISDEELLKATQLIEQNEPARFSVPLKQSDLDNLVKSGLSSKTEKKSKWAVNMFDLWQKNRNKNTDSFVPNNNLINMSSEVLNETLGYFIAEVRTISGKEYKPNTLYEIIIAIQNHLRQQGRLINFLDDAAFDGLRRILDAKMKQLSKQGLGMQRRSAAIISEEQENELWNKRILETETPQMLLDTLLYTLGLHFA
ncbi:zinc finger MYM-type protein 2-like [Ruditapes philippinarum]|uniref:zinc finger MYM-type protein 2-like n=1 Tax=Ruditapes philippinarum TaxID=129788 RepID=UPI00295A5D5C|nr:zinc finger MYM-type protein 2-like [Ruditapes philippinarum]